MRSLHHLIVACLITYWVLLFAGSHVPTQGQADYPVNDKLLHLGGYLGLTILLCGSWRVSGKIGPRHGLVFGIVALYGALDEFTQLFVAGRQADPFDWLADLGGGLLGLLLYRLVEWAVERCYSGASFRSFLCSERR